MGFEQAARNSFRIAGLARPAKIVNPNTLIAPLIWGSVGTGFLIYGKKQQSMIPLFGGIIMVALSYFVASALYMSIACLVLMAVMYFLVRQGY